MRNSNWTGGEKSANVSRPHRALNDQTPTEFASDYAARDGSRKKNQPTNSLSNWPKNRGPSKKHGN